MFVRKRNSALFTVILLGSILSGCQVVNVKQQALNVTIANERNSILTQDKLSEASLNVLSMSGQEAKACTDSPDTCVNQLKNLPQILDEQLLSAASEMYLAKAMALSDSSECKISRFTKHKPTEEQKVIQNKYDECLDQQLSLLDKSIRYSYAYLFSTKRQPTDRIFDNRQVQIRDFYNQAIAKMVSVYDLRYPQKNVVEPQIHIGKSVYSIDFEFHRQLSGQKLEKLISSYNLNFSGLRTINRRDGFGSEFV
ncbi:alpha/beta hydrolase, partial [Acinetobacter baumannii]